MADREIEFQRIQHVDVTPAQLQECSQLFSDQYGYWSATAEPAHLRNQPIKLSPEKINSYFAGGDGWLATARVSDELIGYAIAVRINLSAGGVSWVTQFVVHKNYQNQLVGSQILKSIWGDSQDFAWGIASANPFAIRALEKATRRRCSPTHMLKHPTAINAIVSKIPYLDGMERHLDQFRSTVDTKFDQDLSQVESKKEIAAKNNIWTMGNISKGEEWLAITFNNQSQIEWTDKEFEAFTKMASNIVQQAYDRMSEQNPQQNHPWASPEKAKTEVTFLAEAMPLPAGCSIVDFGCGSGRHANALAALGYQITGIDFSPSAIRRAKSEATGNTEFLQGDCRDVKLERKFDAGICLYDVIGSFSDDASNQRILNNLTQQLKPGAPLAFSVMSYDYIENRATNKVGNGNVREKLNSIKASNIMQESGEIFNPDYILLDTRNKVVYRREIFDNEKNFRMEEIVRDRRYTFNDLRKMCKSAGLTVLAIGYIRAGAFQMINDSVEEATKEILVLAKKELV
ncbi:GNAT family N-acetyltransferase [Kozakia baliensis]|uniref:Uncharacterized protein n=1 Tax=Kozakia baliensis TaxID=153496 RepID=A0A1D8USR4_9PROT|nr:GNAT family N-acetyltransferase [Kozakia baliensis]AOX16684.1 hypothetical protein A0U89_05575 [Kozakia baliensis]GBR25882.1 methyltransferase type 12 [Kozakia baliensis NRIC 0488]GEL64847.1 hypothetical protein KBA01_21330 [Kozakia baliensis]